ncbi:hypothetical protein ABQE93_03675 [Mycolicibacterium sp. XJ662]
MRLIRPDALDATTFHGDGDPALLLTDPACRVHVGHIAPFLRR